MIKQLILAFLMAGICSAATVDLTWDASPPEDHVTHYTVYWSNYSGNVRKFAQKGSKVVAGNSASVTMSETEKLYFRVTASSTTMESLYSNMVYVSFIRTPGALKFQRIDIR